MSGSTRTTRSPTTGRVKFYALGALLVVIAVAGTLIYLDDGTLADFMAMFTGSSDVATSSDPDGIPIFFTMLTIYSVPLLVIYGIVAAVIERSIQSRTAQGPTPSH